MLPASTPPAPHPCSLRAGRWAHPLAVATGGLALVLGIGLSAADSVAAPPARRDVAYYTDGRVKGEDKLRLEQIFITAAALAATDPAAALQTCQEWHDRDPNNAMGLYVGAAAHAARKDWVQATKAIEQGNALPACYLYVNHTGVARLDAPHGSHQDLFLSLAKNGAEGGLEAMRAVRTMAFRVMATEPRHMAGNVLVGRAMVLDVDKALEAYYQARNEPAMAQRYAAHQEAVKLWDETVRKPATNAVMESCAAENRLLFRYRRPADSWADSLLSAVFRPTRVAADRAVDACAAKEAVLVAKLLASFPEG